MKKIIYSVFVALFIVLNSCSDKQEFVDIYYNGVDPQFSETEIESGQVLAESLRKTVKKIKKDGIDLSNTSAIQEISLETTLEVIEKKYAITEDEMAKAKEKAILYNKENQYLAKSSIKSNNPSLTIMQERALNAIEKARINSRSAIAFMDKLAAINQRVDDLVPEGERELLHRIIANTYYELKEINNLVRAGYLPGKAEARPKKIKTGTELAFNDTSLSSLTKIAHANGEVIVLPEIIVVAPASNGGNGISLSDWYLLQDSFGDTYEDDGSTDNSNDDNSSTEEEESWWDSWGSCAWAFAKLGLSSASVVLGCSPPALGATVATSCYVAATGFVASSVSVGLACR